MSNTRFVVAGLPGLTMGGPRVGAMLVRDTQATPTTLRLWRRSSVA